MPVAGTVTTATSGDPLPENAKELLAAYEQQQKAGVVEEADAPAPSDTPAPSPEASPETPSVESAPPAAVAEPAWRKVLSEVPEDELFADPKLSGRLGRLVQKQVAKQMADTTAQQARVAKQAADDALMNQNPAAYVQRVQQERAQSQQFAALFDQVYTPLRTDFSELPEPVQKELAGKSYEHLSPADSAVAYFRDRNALMVEHEVQKRLGAAVKEAREAERKKVLAEVNGTAPRPDTGTGAPPVTKTFTPSSVERMSQGDYRSLGKTPQERVATVFGGARSR